MKTKKEEDEKRLSGFKRSTIAEDELVGGNDSFLALKSTSLLFSVSHKTIGPASYLYA